MIWLKRFCLAAAILTVCGCYFPSDFRADLQIDSYGNYVFRYKGKLTNLSLLKEIAVGNLKDAELTKKVLMVQRDLARDRGFGKGISIERRIRHIRHIGNSTFRVAYKRKGNISLERSFNFIRFNSRILSLSRVPYKNKHNKGWLIKIIGDKPNEDLIKALEKSKLVADGRLRIQTEGSVLRHNADKSYRTGSSVVYVWNFKTFSRTPPFLFLRLQSQ